MLSVFDYIDHRTLLRDLYRERKAANYRFSYRYVARRLGYSSSSVFPQVVAGRLHITERVLSRLCSVFELKDDSAEYFGHLVRFNQARSAEERRFCLDKLHRFMSSKIKTVPPQQFEFYQEWYYNALWAMMGYYRFDGNYARMGAALLPPITASQAKAAVALLCRLGMLQAADDGNYRPVQPIVTTGDDARSVAISGFHLRTMDLARTALDTVDRAYRENSTLTVGISAQGYQDLKAEVRECRRKILEIARRATAPDRVYQINFQMFPLTQSGVG